MLGIKYHNQTLVYKQTKGVPDYSGPLKEKDTNGRVRIQSAKKDIQYLIKKTTTSGGYFIQEVFLALIKDNENYEGNSTRHLEKKLKIRSCSMWYHQDYSL